MSIFQDHEALLSLMNYSVYKGSCFDSPAFNNSTSNHSSQTSVITSLHSNWLFKLTKIFALLAPCVFQDFSASASFFLFSACFGVYLFTEDLCLSCTLTFARQ